MADEQMATSALLQQARAEGAADEIAAIEAWLDKRLPMVERWLRINDVIENERACGRRLADAVDKYVSSDMSADSSFCTECLACQCNACVNALGSKMHSPTCRYGRLRAALEAYDAK